MFYHAHKLLLAPLFRLSETFKVHLFRYWFTTPQKYAFSVRPSKIIRKKHKNPLFLLRNCPVIPTKIAYFGFVESTLARKSRWKNKFFLCFSLAYSYLCSVLSEHKQNCETLRLQSGEPATDTLGTPETFFRPPEEGGNVVGCPEEERMHEYLPLYAKHHKLDYSKSMKPLITLSFPVYEGDEFVADSLKSVLSQDYENLEILIIDDRGKTNAMQIVRDTLETYPHKHTVRMIRHPRNLKNGGVRNTSIDQAKGEYLFFMDADDILPENSISTLVNAMEGKPMDMVKGTSLIFDNDGKELGRKGFTTSFTFEGTTALDAIYAHNEKYWGTMTNAIYNLQFLKKTGIRCVHPYIEDEAFFFHVITLARHGAILSDLTYRYRHHLTSTINQIRMNDLTAETAKYAMEIIQDRYLTLKGWENTVTREKVLLESIKWGLHYLYQGKRSKLITKEVYMQMATAFLSYPKMRNVQKATLTEHEYKKHVFYSIIAYLPLPCRLFLIHRLNFNHYKKVFC